MCKIDSLLPEHESRQFYLLKHLKPRGLTRHLFVRFQPSLAQVGPTSHSGRTLWDTKSAVSGYPQVSLFAKE